MRVLPRLDQGPRATKRRHELDRRRGRRCQLVVAHCSDRVDREAAEACEVELDVVLGEPELLEIGADCLSGEALVAQLRDRRVPVPLRELLPVRPEDKPVVDHLRQLAAERSGDALLDRQVRAVIVATDHVCDLQIEVVRDRGKLVRRRSVRAHEGRSVVPEAHRAVRVSLGRTRGERTLRDCGVARSAFALPNRAVVEQDAEPLEIAQDRRLPTLDRARRVGVVDAQDQHACLRVGEAAVGDGRQRVPEVERAGRARCEPKSNVHSASIATCPGCASTRASQERIARYGSRSKSPSCATWV